MSSRPSLRTSTAGFTLIELLIVVTVIAILAGFALPSFQQYIRQARRMDGIADLLELQNTVEKCRVNQVTYGSCTTVVNPYNDPNDPRYNVYYAFTMPEATTSAYTFTATANTGFSQERDEGCSVLRLHEDGEKYPPPSSSKCWKK